METKIKDRRSHFEEPPNIIHRSHNRIIVAGQKEVSNLDALPRGWKSPLTQPYKPIGVFQKVVPVIEELKA
jgi:hypothetical protein